MMKSNSTFMEVIKKSINNMSTHARYYDDHLAPHHDITLGQMTMFVIYGFAALVSIFRALGSISRTKKQDPKLLKGQDSKEITIDIKGLNTVNEVLDEAPDTVKKPTLPLPPTFNAFLRYIVVFGILMTYFYLCDYIKVFPIEARVYSQDIFLFLVFLLFLVACSFTVKPTKDGILNRDQTEEWKGWMQVMFVWYHYFAAKDWYNWIRVYIACYVWMTGFGNFSFFWVRKDFSLWRLIKMMFRLNFLVIFVVIMTDNEYMLYYICAMHTYWFVTVYLFMRVLNSWNEDRVKMGIKFAAYIICNALIFEIPGACSTIFRPLSFIFGYTSKNYDVMHEWEFRAGLDHWACLFGMFCAYNYPHFEAFMKYIEGNSSSMKERYTKLAAKAALVSVTLGVGVAWYFTFMQKEKFDYNQTHCYSSLVPIVCFIVLRNSFPILRRHYIHMFAWLGKITLETYLSQLHIYLQGNAKQLIGYINESPLLTFSLATIIYLLISYLLFHLTTEFSSYLIPKDLKLMFRQSVIGAVFVVLATGIAYILRISIAGHKV